MQLISFTCNRIKAVGKPIGTHFMQKRSVVNWVQICFICAFWSSRMTNGKPLELCKIAHSPLNIHCFINENSLNVRHMTGYSFTLKMECL